MLWTPPCCSPAEAVQQTSRDHLISDVTQRRGGVERGAETHYSPVRKKEEKQMLNVFSDAIFIFIYFMFILSTSQVYKHYHKTCFLITFVFQRSDVSTLNTTIS